MAESSLELEEAVLVMLSLLDLVEGDLGRLLVGLGEEHDLLAVFLLQGLLLLQELGTVSSHQGLHLFLVERFF